MKLQHLRFFAAVIEGGGVSRAAERLHVSQPAISAGLKALEHYLGQPLFERSGGRRRIVATPKAREFHAQVLDILERCEAARASFRSPRPRVPGATLGVLRTLSAASVAAVAATLSQAAAPSWRFREGGAEDLARWLRQGRIDAAWTVVEANAANAAILWREPFVLLAARNHRLASSRRRKVTLADLDGEALVLRGACELKPGRLRAEGIGLRVVARTDRDEVAVKLVAQGVGVAIAPRSLATPDVGAVPVADLALARSIGLRWRAALVPSTLSSLRAAIAAGGHPRM